MNHPRPRIALLWLASGLATSALLNWHFRFNAAGDTINYFEIAYKYTQGLPEAVVQLWSPLYSWMLMPIVALPRSWHLPAAHGMQVALFLFSMWSTWRLAAMAGLRERADTGGAMLFVFGVSMACALTVIPARYLTPDLLALAIVPWFFARAGEEAAGTADRPWRRCLTGAVWGAGYLARAYMTAFGGVSLLLASLMVRRNRRPQEHLRWLGPYVIGFLIVGGPWIATLSRAAGHLTSGEAGSRNLLGQLDREAIEPPPWPRTLPSGRVVSFERPFTVTLPESYDAVPGGTFRYHNVWRTYPRILVGNVEALFFGFYSPDLPLFWPLGILFVLAWTAFSPGAWGVPRAPDTAVWLLLSGAIGILMFVAVHVESRYVAPFIVLIAAGIAQQSGSLAAGRRAAHATMLTLVGVLFWSFPFLTWLDAQRSSRALNPQILTAESRWLAEHGGTYATVGGTYDLGMPAWLSETRVVASVDLKDASPDDCEAVRADLASLEVTGVLARTASACGSWQPVPGSGWLFWDLRARP